MQLRNSRKKGGFRLPSKGARTTTSRCEGEGSDGMKGESGHGMRGVKSMGFCTEEKKGLI